MAALNIASLPKYIEELRNYMSSTPVDILAIKKTRLDGYSLERMDRNRNGGGIALYIKNSINYEINQPLDENLELLCVKVIKPKAKPFIIGTWYRPPESPNELAFESALERLHANNC